MYVSLALSLGRNKKAKISITYSTVAGDCASLGLTGSSVIYAGCPPQPVSTFCTNDGWTVIQSRGQFGNPPDYFSKKLWSEYVAGFGTPGTRG